MSNPADSPSSEPEIGVYECEVTLRFRLIEEKANMHHSQAHLVDMLVDAFSYGSDEYVDALQSDVAIQEVTELEASPAMRRQLIRLRNASWA